MLMNEQSNNVTATTTVDADPQMRNNIGAAIFLPLLLMFMALLLSSTSAQAERSTYFDISPAGAHFALGFTDGYVEEAVKLAGTSVETQHSRISQQAQPRQPELVKVSHDIYVDLMVSQAQRIARQTAGDRFPEHEVNSMISEIERLIQQFEHQDNPEH